MATLTLQPDELVQQLRQLAVEQETTPETLLDQAVREFIHQATGTAPKTNPQGAAIHAAFESEAANFERMKPMLLQDYPGRVVAIYQGKVIESGDDILDVYAAVVKKHGVVPCYVQWVEAIRDRLREKRICQKGKRSDKLSG